MEREQFTFYSSFANAAKQIKNKAARADFYDAICAYALYEEEPNLSKIADAAAMGFTLVKPILDAGRRKAKNGQRGGEQKQEQTESKPEAKRKQEQAESKEKPEARANPKQEKEQEKGQEKEQMLYTPPTPSTAPAKANPKQRMETMVQETLSGMSEELLTAVRDWMRYKAEKNQCYKETGLQSLLTQIRKSAEEFGDSAVCDVIRESMGSNYAGIMFDRLRMPRRQSKTQEFVAAGRWEKGLDAKTLDKQLADLSKL